MEPTTRKLVPIFKIQNESGSSDSLISSPLEAMAQFDRLNPLFERNCVPFMIISSGSKSHENYTVRILQGHRPTKNATGRERVFRLEMSDECNLVKGTSDFEQAVKGCSTPINNFSSGLGFHKTSHAPVIHAPFMTADNIGSVSNQIQLSHKSNAITNRSIDLYELEVGESDFEELRRLVM